MTVEVNGVDRDVAPGTTVAELMLELTGAARGSAAVLDGEVVPRSTWDTTVVTDGARVEVVTAVQGG